MKLKTTAIAMAVAGTVAAPMAVQADIYASARIGYINKSTDSFSGATGVDSSQIQGLGSRFGARGETDLGNGMTGFGRYEWSVDVDGDSTSGTVTDSGANTHTTSSSTNTIGLRHGYVGLKGDFGSITMGQTYHTYYNHVNGPIDIPWWGAAYTWLGYPGRTSHGISYEGSTGAVSFGATVYMVDDDDSSTPAVDESDVTDGIEIAATFGVGDMNLGVGYSDPEVDDDATTSADESDPTIGITLSGIAAGDASLGVSFATNDAADGYVLNGSLGNGYAHYEVTNTDADALAGSSKADTSTLTIGYTQSLGRKTTAWYEYQTTDMDMTAADFSVIRAMLVYNIE